jgi:hypothetical protein
MITTRQELEAEGAYILEQEGWVIQRVAHETRTRRTTQFAERSADWQRRVNEFREQNPEAWPAPPDNS